MLTDQEKDAILYSHCHMNVPQTQLATMYNCSRRTIYRVLQEKGGLTQQETLSAQEKDMLELIRSIKLNHGDLVRAVVLLQAEKNYKRSKSQQQPCDSLGVARA